MGYRLAMIVSGGLALILADQWLGWGYTYMLMGALMLACALATLWAPEPEVLAPPPRSLRQAVAEPLREFFTRRGALAVLLLIVLQAGRRVRRRAVHHLPAARAGYSPTEVGTVNKIMGIAATVVGALAGGMLMARWTLYRSLMVFGLLQAVSNLAYWLIAVSPRSLAHGRRRGPGEPVRRAGHRRLRGPADGAVPPALLGDAVRAAVGLVGGGAHLSGRTAHAAAG